MVHLICDEILPYAGTAQELVLTHCLCVFQMVHLIRDEILPYAGAVPKSFVMRIMDLLNRGSIHSAMSDTFVGKGHIKLNTCCTVGITPCQTHL